MSAEYSVIKTEVTDVKQDVERGIRKHRSLHIAQAIAFLLLGIMAFVLPNVLALSFSLMIGVLFLIGGLLKSLMGFRSGTHWWSQLSALLAVAVGLLLILSPITGTVTLATVLAIFLLLEGASEILLANQFQPASQWGWLLASGILSLALGVILLVGWPELTVMFLGFAIGLNLIFYGASLLAMSLSAKANTDVL